MKRHPRDRRCTYLVTLQHIASPEEIRELSEYLSFLAVEDFDVVVIDHSPLHVVERNRRVLRWVSRHIAATRLHHDPVRAAIDTASCEKVIVADARVRYSEDVLDDLFNLLEFHEVVEPQDYLDPLPWWGGVDAGRMLVHRGINALPDRGATFAFRRSAVRGDVFPATGLFVRRIPPAFDEWLQRRPVEADADFAMPAKTIFFFSVLPIMAVLLLLGGGEAAAAYAGAIASGSMALALRGRAGAGPFFPWRACLFAPVWILERSISVYWALWQRLTQGGAELPTTPAEERGVGTGFSRSTG